MRLTGALVDERGTTSVEFALSAPLFALMIAGVMGAGLLFWAQTSLQHGVEMAARCASINKAICGQTSDIQNYAVAQTAGLSPPASIFSVSTSACGTLVSASYPIVTVRALWGISPFTLTAQSCYPI
jgi:Flp pilus assembly protein TadG